VIPRASLSATDRADLDGACNRAQARRACNAAAGLCINENARGTHGKATHGCRCEHCYLVHAGHSKQDRVERLIDKLDREIAKTEAQLAFLRRNRDAAARGVA